MKNSGRRLFTGVFAAAAVLRCMSIVPAAYVTYTHTDPDSGDKFKYTVEGNTVGILEITDGGDGEVLVPGEINSKSVQKVSCQSSGLSRLDVSNCSGLTELNCSGNKLEVLDISKNTLLYRLSCKYNDLATLDISNNPNLEVKIYDNKTELIS